MVGAIINNLVDERRWKIVFGTRVIEIMKVSANTDSAYFLLMGTGLETHEV